MKKTKRHNKKKLSCQESQLSLTTPVHDQTDPQPIQFFPLTRSVRTIFFLASPSTQIPIQIEFNQIECNKKVFIRPINIINLTNLLPHSRRGIHKAPMNEEEMEEESLIVRGVSRY